MPDTLIAVDVGNSRIKIGSFIQDDVCGMTAHGRLPKPVDTLDLPLVDEHAGFDEGRLLEWLHHVPTSAVCLVASVNAAAAERFCKVLAERTSETAATSVRRLTHVDVPLEVRVPAPERVGIDRLASAAAANRLRQPDRAAIVIDHGTAITIDLVDPSGAFVGGAILPGMALGAHALAAQTDALPHVSTDTLSAATPVIGDATIPAIEAGLYWGTFGAIRELVALIAVRQSDPPDVFLTGGAAANIAQPLSSATGLRVQHVPHLVLSGVALVYRP